MDRQLAERMVGAAVLLAVLVLVVPALLDGGGGAEPADVLPPAVLPVEPRRTIRIDDQGRSPPVPQAALPASTAASSAPDSPSGTPSDSMPDGATGPAPPVPVDEPATGAGVPVTETIPAARLAVPDRTVEPAAPVGAVAAPVREAPVPAPVPPAPAPAPAAAKAAPPAPAGDWVVQLGSFANPTNAERLASQVRSRGFAASVSQTGSGASRMFRVRAGSATTREAADRLAAELAAAGVPGTVVRR